MNHDSVCVVVDHALVAAAPVAGLLLHSFGNNKKGASLKELDRVAAAHVACLFRHCFAITESMHPCSVRQCIMLACVLKHLSIGNWCVHCGRWTCKDCVTTTETTNGPDLTCMICNSYPITVESTDSDPEPVHAGDTKERTSEAPTASRGASQDQTSETTTSPEGAREIRAAQPTASSLPEVNENPQVIDNRPPKRPRWKAGVLKRVVCD
eukprot:610078-Amphidinium_carterae.2